MVPMTRQHRLRLGIALLGALWAFSGNPADRELLGQQTLWEKRDARMANLYADNRARRVGDLVTILVSENTDVANTDQRGLAKQTASDADGQFNVQGSSVSGDFDSTSNRTFNGTSNFSSAREFSDRFTVTVTDVLPNGNLVIHGIRQMQVENDVRTLTVSGVVRDLDVRNDNSVLSQNVANLQIRFAGKGPETRFTNQNWLTRRINRWWPF